MNIVADTSAIIKNSTDLEKLIEEDNVIIVTSTTCDELDNMKESSDQRRSFMGRDSLRFIERNEEKIKFVISDVVDKLPNGFGKTDNDSKIISAAIKENAMIATRDRGMKVRCMSCGIDILDLEDNGKEVNIDGYTIFEWDCEDSEVSEMLIELAEDNTHNIFNIEVNNFAVLKDTSRPIFNVDDNCEEVVDYQIQGIYQWDGEELNLLKYRDVKNDFVGKVQPRNLQQKMLFSLMQNDNVTIKLCSGGYGTGKDYVMLTNALDMVKKNKYDRIVWFRNPVNVKGIEKSGYLPGSFQEKLEPYSAVLDDILGDSYGTKMFIDNGKLELGNLGAVRGRTFNRSIIFLTEMQNCSTEVIQLLLSRVGKDSILVMNGDMRQLDDVKHSISSIKETVEILHGQNKFGWIKLQKVERSDTADLARLFDER